MSKLSKLLRERLNSERLSVRDAAKLIGVSHATVARAANGETVEVDTLVKIADFLRMPVESLLVEEDERTDHIEKLLILMSIEPELIDVLSEITKRVKAEFIDEKILSEIAAFAAFRLEQHEKMGKPNK